MKQGLNQMNVFVINDFCGETVSLSVTATTSSVKFGNTSSKLNYDVMVTNAGTKTAFIAFGNGSATAVVPSSNPSTGAGTTGATPILAGAIYNLQKNTDGSFADTCAAICGGSDSTTLYFTSVQGS